MRTLHRTSQQILIGLIFTWLNDFADYPTDERNEASVEYVRKLRDMYREIMGEQGFKECFPLI